MKKVVFIIAVFILVGISIFIKIHFGIVLNAEKQQVIDSLSQTILKYYVIEDDATKIARLLEKNQHDGKYKYAFTREKFWKVVNDDIHSVCKDQHLIFVSSPQMVEYAKNTIQNIDIENDNDRIESEKDNHGIAECKILKDNIGDLNLTRFANPIYGKAALIEAMKKLENVSALIIDLRDNGGGHFEQVQVLITYFIGKNDSLLIGSGYTRYNNEKKEFYTINNLPGKRFDKVKLYILTSNYTFSAAESFINCMKYYKKALIIGEQTRGGSHAVEWKIICKYYVLRVPVSKVLFPGKDWEGIGITPDIITNSSNALDTALNIISRNNKSKL